MEEKKLYPLRFIPITDEYVWGSEIFKIADLGYRDSIAQNGWLSANTFSEIMDTYMDRVVGDRVFEIYGRQFPVQVKTIVCKGKMPLRVHPDDEIASQRYDALGKEKLWYVCSASPNSRIWLGWKGQVDATVVIEGATDGSIADSLNSIQPKAGDFFRIHPGVVHGAEGDLQILEVSQSSALDFCLYAWGQELGAEEFDESMTLIDALDFIDCNAFMPDFAPLTSPAGTKALQDIPQFTVRKIDLREPLHISGGDGFAIYYCLYGKAAVQAEIEDFGKADYIIDRDSVLLVPAEVEDFVLKPLEGYTSVIEIMSQIHPTADPYIRPGVPEKVEGDE